RLSEVHGNPAVATGIFVTACVLLTLLHLFHNGSGIASTDVWLDEASTFLVAAYPIKRLIALSIEFHSQPPLYYILFHYLSLVSSQTTVLRGMSWLFCLLFVYFVLFELNEIKLVSRVLFCLLFIFNSHTTFLSHELRPYALSALGTFVSTVLFYRLT